MDSISIEIVKNMRSSINKTKLIQMCSDYLSTQEIYPGLIIKKFDEPLSETIECIIIEDYFDNNYLDLSKVKWYVYTLSKYVSEDNITNGENQLHMYKSWTLPSNELHGSWENLIYDNNIKIDLLSYVQGMMTISEKGVDTNIITSNKVVLLHGPPGTGKTSLCRALAHKLSIRLQERCKYGQLIEINSHSLFSKWFAESGKLVSKMFESIHDFLQDPNMFLCVLIDEIESLTHARMHSIGNEPMDAIRVVNSVLTHLDSIRNYPNVLILTTSNITNMIDGAFIDRADIKQFIGLPSVQAIYKIYYSCLQELMKAKIIQPADTLLTSSVMNMNGNCTCENSRQLLKLCERSVGFSGRTLRKVPLTTYAICLRNEFASLTKFLNAMDTAITRVQNEKDTI